MKNKKHMFSPGETIQGIIRKYNRHDMSNKIVETLTKEFIDINENKVPHVGDTFMIPLFDFATEKSTNVIPLQPKISKKVDISNVVVEDNDSDAIMLDRQKRRELARNQPQPKEKVFKEHELAPPITKRKKKLPEVPPAPTPVVVAKKEKIVDTIPTTKVEMIPTPTKRVMRKGEKPRAKKLTDIEKAKIINQRNRNRRRR